MSIVTNQQGWEHTEQAWKEFGTDYSADGYLRHIVNALPHANVLTNPKAGVSDPSLGVEGYLPAQYQAFCQYLFTWYKETVPYGQTASVVGFGYPFQMLLDLGKGNLAATGDGCIDPRLARPEGTSSKSKYEESHLPYGALREGKKSNAAYKASDVHKDGSAVYELELRRGVKSTVVGRLYVTAFDYPEHIGAPTTETNICRAFAYSRLLRGAPTETTPLYILYEHCL